ncbi:hypothetical protein HGRIS_005550 [Hohenbuehelia grisea]|uniref:T6SS Phospholipase effector Tle1-like catalytic domain-containing protein n=1 Tax=Hohenbuehelia grisea TaxID=104357 RepID=A0ABR3JZG2_9AGAR
MSSASAHVEIAGIPTMVEDPDGESFGLAADSPEVPPLASAGLTNPLGPSSPVAPHASTKSNSDTVILRGSEHSLPETGPSATANSEQVSILRSGINVFHPPLVSVTETRESSDPVLLEQRKSLKQTGTRQEDDNGPISRVELATTKADGQSLPKFTCKHSQSKRNLVVCIDGTSNQFSRKNTNVVELYSNLVKSTTQLTYYNSGIGTYADPACFSVARVFQKIDHTIDIMIAWNFKRIVLSAYQWLSENYQEGDRIFLFGFSRGAYQVRVIAGMIKLVGLLHKGNNDQIAFAYQLYISITDRTNRSGKDMGNESRLLCAHFQSTFCCPNVTVHFVGAWDTVSSIGVVRGRSLPETTTGMEHVCLFRHALALDERRVKFLPEYANGGLGVAPQGKSSQGNVKEVWFPGSHSNIGGGIDDNINLNQFGPALRWMTYEAITYGLEVKAYSSPHLESTALSGVHEATSNTNSAHRKVGRKHNSASWIKSRLPSWITPSTKHSKASSNNGSTHWAPFIKPTQSLSPIWWALELPPFIRHLSYKDQDSTVLWPHLGRSRVVKEGHLIHQSVFDAIDFKPEKGKSYIPRARIEGDLKWGSLSVLEGRKAEDPYSSAQDLIHKLESLQSGVSRQSLTKDEEFIWGKLVQSPTGPRSITEAPGALDAIVQVLQRTSAEDYNQKAVDMLVTCLAEFSSQPLFRRYSYHTINNVFSLASSALRRSSQTKVLRCIGKRPFYGHTRRIHSIVVSPNGTRIASASEDDSIRIWDAKTGEICGAPLMGHTDWVLSVAFSPDGNQLVSGSGDHTVRVWNVQTGQEAMAPLRGHTDWVRSVAYSPDGTRIASGADDRTVQVWDAKTGGTAMEPLGGHTSLVLSVAFSPDGHLIASGSSDNTIRIWNAETGGRALLSLEGHSDSVTSVAFSPDGTQIVSGSYDSTIRIWDVKTGQLVKALQGHTNCVRSVAYSPDGARIVSGSDDRSIRVWDARSGEEIKKLMGHTNSIRSVAVTPDGERIVSGSDDKTIRVWDMATGEQLLGPVDGWDDEESR